MSYSKPYRIYNSIRNSLGYYNRIGYSKGYSKDYSKGYSKGYRISLRSPEVGIGDTPARTLAKTHCSGPVRSIALVVVALRRYR